MIIQQKNMVDKLLLIKQKYQDVRTAVEKGTSNDHSSDPLVVLKHLKDQMDKIIDLQKSSVELKKHSEIITSWF